MKPKRIIDMHHHTTTRSAKDYAQELAHTAEVHRIEKIVLLGLEWKNMTSPGRNDDVLTCWRECPELIVPFACVDPEWAVEPTRIDALKEKGFAGLKFIHPRVPYHHESLYPWYERAEALRMPTLFHLGIVSRQGSDDPDRVDNNLMRPIYMDTIARAFPELQVIGAHMGNPWYDEAAMSCRWNPNLYFDLSGSTLKKKRPAFLGELLWWGGNTYPVYADAFGRSAWEKIMFGSDVKAEDIHDVISDYQRLIETLELSEDLADAIFYRTGAAILSHAGIQCDSD